MNRYFVQDNRTEIKISNRILENIVKAYNHSFAANIVSSALSNDPL